MFCFTLRDAISLWCKTFMQCHSGCTFLELEVAFYKHYCTIQNDEQVYMALRIMKQGSNKKVEVYYEWVLKLSNHLHCKVDNNLLITFFRAGLVL
jgi:hypothetical protein